MYAIAIFTILALILSLTIGKSCVKEARGIFIFICGFIGIVVGFLVALVLAANLPEQAFSSTPIELVAMHTADSLNGAFVLGSGSIQNQTRYIFMERDSDGSFVQKSIAVTDEVHIIEDPGLHHAGFWTTTYKTSYRPAGFNIWTFALLIRPKTIIREEFRVPTGTVLQQFNVK